MLNIKRAETYDLARSLADKTGLSLTEAVTMALRDKLEALDMEQRSSVATKQAAALRIAEEFRAAWGGSLPTQAELNSALYDENGLPR